MSDFFFPFRLRANNSQPTAAEAEIVSLAAHLVREQPWICWYSVIDVLSVSLMHTELWSLPGKEKRLNRSELMTDF